MRHALGGSGPLGQPFIYYGKTNSIISTGERAYLYG